MPEEKGSIPEQSELSRRETLKLVAAVAAFGAALGVRPAGSFAQAKSEGKGESKGEMKSEGKGAAKSEGKGAAKGEGKGEMKGEGKATGK